MWMLGVALAMEPPEEPEEVEDKQPWERTGWGFGGLPAINYNSDEGFGFGVVGSLYKYDGETGPYKTAFNLVLFATTKAVQTHTLEVDWLEVRGAPVRLTVRGEFASTSTSNYCGTGPDVTCDPALAEAAADQAELTGEAREDFVRRYYRARFLNPNLRADVRWALDPMPHRVELLLGYRANAMIPGDFQDKEPWPGSLYAQDFPGGEGGLVSVLQAGVVLDDRDNEPAPIRGYWIEGSLRAASFLLGSDYDYVGFNATLRGYVPLGTDRLVLADRLMLDGLVGDAHTLELTRSTAASTPAAASVSGATWARASCSSRSSCAGPSGRPWWLACSSIWACSGSRTWASWARSCRTSAARCKSRFRAPEEGCASRSTRTSWYERT
jgi:hypothetical protein